MSKRARYDGPFDEVFVQTPSGRIVTIENGHLLPDDDDIPAAFRDSLLEQDVWTEVKQSASSPAKKEA